MWGVATEADEPELKGKNDARITSSWARLCRKYSLDELPQLAQVVFGQMSLVGPRPITRKELEKYYGADASEVMRLRPGVSGLWQVRGRNALSYHRRKRLDLFLVRHYGAALYFRILCATIPNVLAGKNAW